MIYISDERIESGRIEAIMRNLNYEDLSKHLWDTEIVSYIAKIHECKGKQELFIHQKPTELDRLVEE